MTDFGVEYDYESVMHYPEKAFSKNKNKTIIPLKVCYYSRITYLNTLSRYLFDCYCLYFSTGGCKNWSEKRNVGTRHFEAE